MESSASLVVSPRYIARGRCSADSPHVVFVLVEPCGFPRAALGTPSALLRKVVLRTTAERAAERAAERGEMSRLLQFRLARRIVAR